MSRLFLILTILACAFSTNAQETFVSAKLTPGDVYVGQPAKLSITTYTNTWFTSAAKIPPLVLSNAFVVPSENNVGTESINGTTFSYVSTNFMIYPYSNETVEIPVLNIILFTPEPGGFKGKEKTVRSKAQKLLVSDAPVSVDKSQWLVANWLSVKQNWSKSLKAVKVGDVVDREISWSASGTMAAFFPDIDWVKTDGLSVYPELPGSNTKMPERGSEQIAYKKQKISYLFEREGRITLPAIKMGYWHARQNRWIDRSLPEIIVEVAANPDLAMLASVRDSLSQLTADPTQNSDLENEAAFQWKTLLPLLLKIAALAILLGLLVYYIRLFILKRKLYLQSNTHQLSKLKQALSKGQKPTIQTALYRWMDHLPTSRREANFSRLCEANLDHVSPSLKSSIDHLFEPEPSMLDTNDQKELLKTVKVLHRKCSKKPDKQARRLQLNP
ncbi:BatD family protein [Mangrovibacterium lignilyticum]|uniref:BatD family protein n=1 Tax=Mangrovibacterium lignilyticum TaxID=2668052 RepID=UPI0013D064E9|nr:BatD family protein [Mangrovibacterium lignilyticum]